MVTLTTDSILNHALRMDNMLETSLIAARPHSVSLAPTAIQILEGSQAEQDLWIRYPREEHELTMQAIQAEHSIKMQIHQLKTPPRSFQKLTRNPRLRMQKSKRRPPLIVNPRALPKMLKLLAFNS